MLPALKQEQIDHCRLCKTNPDLRFLAMCNCITSAHTELLSCVVVMNSSGKSYHPLSAMLRLTWSCLGAVVQRKALVFALGLTHSVQASGF